MRNVLLPAIIGLTAAHKAMCFRERQRNLRWGIIGFALGCYAVKRLSMSNHRR